MGRTQVQFRHNPIRISFKNNLLLSSLTAMPEQKLQDAKNHAKFDPAFHYVLAPIFLLHLIYWITRLVRHPSLTDAWNVVAAFGLLVLVFKVRLYALAVQDRVIRLEERLRLQQVLSEPLRARILELSEDQLIGLRFAPDQELEGLVSKALKEKLNRKQIKELIQTWRPDHFRI